MTQLERLAKAINRLDYFGAPPDDSPVFVEHDSIYELLDRSEGECDNMDEATVITLGDLRKLIEEGRP